MIWTVVIAIRWHNTGIKQSVSQVYSLQIMSLVPRPRPRPSMSLSNTGSAEYAALASNPTKEKGNGDVISAQSSSDRPRSPIPSRFHLNPSRISQLYFRLLAFFIIEMGYITLAALCLAKPIPLKIYLNLTDSEVKGGFTVIFVVWQSLAVLMGSSIVTDAFSREWAVPLAQITPGTADRPPAMVPAAIDRVSTITSGFLDRMLHLLIEKSSGTFKLAFFASLLFIALSSFGPGTINAGIAFIDEPTTIQIGRLLSQVDTEIGYQQLSTAERRANFIVRIEEIEDSPYRFKLQPNMLTAVPKVDLATFNTTIEYDSDVVEFHYDCHWEAPQFSDLGGNVIVNAAGQRWIGAMVATGPVIAGSSVGPLTLMDNDMGEVGTSAFIFSGGNNSIFDNSSPFAINLGSLPVTFRAQGAGFYMPDAHSCYAPLSSILVCDPHPQITGGRIKVTNDGALTVVASRKTPIGNIPRNTANLIFANALQVALIPDDMSSWAYNNVNDVAGTMFMSSTPNWNTTVNIRPLSLPSINKNMDAVMLSAAKAFIDNNGTSLTANFEWDTISAIKREPKLVLSTSKPLFIAVVILVVITTFLLFALCRSGLARRRYPFDLNHVLAVLREDGGRKAFLLASWNIESDHEDV